MGIKGVKSLDKQSCEINWLGPSKQLMNSERRFDFTCIYTLRDDEIDFYEGCHEPPNELEYRRLGEGWD